MSKVVITRFPSYCLINGNVPTKELLDFTSTNNRHLADYQKKQRGQLESKDEMELLTTMWEHGHGARPNIEFRGQVLTIDEAKARLSAKASQNLVSVMMAGQKTLKRALAGCVDDRFSVYDHLEETFPVGILPEVEEILSSCGTEYVIKDKRVAPKPVYEGWGLDNKWSALRPPQERMEVLCKEHEHFGIEWCVGSGKTLGLALPIIIHQVNTLYVVPSIELVQQTARKIAEYTNIEPDMIGECHGSRMELRPVTVVTMATLERHLQKFKDYGYDQLIVDDAHFAGARGLYEAVNELNCYYRYFASGTLYRVDHEKRVPGRLDLYGENLLLKALIGEVKDFRSYQDGVDANYLCQVTVECVDPGPQMPGCGYKEARDKGIVNNAYRNSNFARVIKEQIDLGKTVLCLVVETAHAESLRETLEDFDVYAGVITGKTKGAIRETLLDDIRARTLHCIVGTACVRTGVDVTTLDVVANVGGLKSYRSTIQGTGRGTRVGKLQNEDGLIEYIKDGAVIIDCMDKHHASLGAHAMQRMLAYHREGFAVPHLQEHFLEEERIRKSQKERAIRTMDAIRAERAKRLPNLKKQLIELEIIRNDPSKKTDMSLPAIIKHLDRVQREINTIEASIATDKKVGEEEDND